MEATLAQLNLSDLINTGLLMAAVIAIALTYLESRSAAHTQRATFLMDLYGTFTSDIEIREAYYLVEYAKFEYDDSFHNSIIERKIDRLLAYADLVCELYWQGIITKREMLFFDYAFKSIGEDKSVRAYLDYLEVHYASVNVKNRPFHSFQKYSRELTMV